MPMPLQFLSHTNTNNTTKLKKVYFSDIFWENNVVESIFENNSGIVELILRPQTHSILTGERHDILTYDAHRIRIFLNGKCIVSVP